MYRSRMAGARWRDTGAANGQRGIAHDTGQYCTRKSSRIDRAMKPLDVLGVKVKPETVDRLVIEQLSSGSLWRERSRVPDSCVRDQFDCDCVRWGSRCAAHQNSRSR